MHDIWPQLRIWFEREERFALATVVKASKPSPRSVGATLAIHEDGKQFIGSVSAGCVENEVIEVAGACLKDGKTRWLQFGPGEGFPWEIELSCGGKIEVRIEPAPHLVETGGVVSKALYDCLEAHRLGMLVSSGESTAFVSNSGEVFGDSDSLGEKLVGDGKKRLASGMPTEEIESEGKRVLFRQLGRRQRLFVIGASHIAINLVSVAKTLQYEVVVVEPRELYSKAERFLLAPDQLIADWPSKGLESFELGENDSLVAITHDPKIDDQALEFALNTKCGYIGALGSKKSHDARCRRLSRKNFDAESLARIFGPVGIDIGSRTPAEIAVSIVAQLISVKSARRTKAQVGTDDRAKG